MTVPPAFANHPAVTRVPSLPQPATADPDHVNATQNLVERLEAQLTPTGPTQDPQWYGWIPLPLRTFHEGMRHARYLLGHGNHRFLDIGSGIGSKLILAHELGYTAAGIERWEPYIEVSRRIAPFAHVFHTHAETFEQYHHFDLVYLYGVAPDQQQEATIKRAITDRMKPGALMFTARQPFPAWLDHQGGLIWRKP